MKSYNINNPAILELGRLCRESNQSKVAKSLGLSKAMVNLLLSGKTEFPEKIANKIGYTWVLERIKDD
jgi:DNA-binding transcriptional regulator YdaS (Cro superfamily)